MAREGSSHRTSNCKSKISRTEKTNGTRVILVDEELALDFCLEKGLFRFVNMRREETPQGATKQISFDKDSFFEEALGWAGYIPGVALV